MLLLHTHPALDVNRGEAAKKDLKAIEANEKQTNDVFVCVCTYNVVCNCNSGVEGHISPVLYQLANCLANRPNNRALLYSSDIIILELIPIMISRRESEQDRS
jgi:hypothetical protein